MHKYIKLLSGECNCFLFKRFSVELLRFVYTWDRVIALKSPEGQKRSFYVNVHSWKILKPLSNRTLNGQIIKSQLTKCNYNYYWSIYRSFNRFAITETATELIWASQYIKLQLRDEAQLPFRSQIPDLQQFECAVIYFLLLDGSYRRFLIYIFILIYIYLYVSSLMDTWQRREDA